MSPQFVDFNSDGHLDIVAGIFDGSPHVAWGSDKGWKQPEQILDRADARIVLNNFWNFDAKKWDTTNRCDPAGQTLSGELLTSAFAWDWDADGDLDLLLGDHTGGHVYLRMNEGAAGANLFATQNVPVQAAGAALTVSGTVATLCMVDWNRDGLMDLACGSMGDAYGSGKGGGVFVYLNTGTTGAPVFGLPLVLVAPSEKASVGAAERPDSGLYMDFGDHDGDGDLDIVVGGYSHWTPKSPVLTSEQKSRVAELEAQASSLRAQLSALDVVIENAIKGLDEAATETKYQELHAAQSEKREPIMEKITATGNELGKLVPMPQRTSCVWLYENTSATPAR